MNATPEIRGVWASVLLPLQRDETLDCAAFALQLENLARAGLHGIYTNGTAGELHNQSEEEFDFVQKEVAALCHDRGLLFQIGASHPCPSVSLARIRRLRPLVPLAFQVILPDWVKTGLSEAGAFLREATAAAGDIPLVLYNPPHAKAVLSPLEIAALRVETPALAGIKVAGGDPSWYAAARRHLAGLAIFVPGHHMATGVLAGAAGSYSNVAALGPAQTVAWFDLVGRDPVRALRIERQILDFFDQHVVPLAREGFCNPALDKFLCAVGDWTPMPTLIRAPYRSVPEANVGPAREALREHLEEFVSL